ncbi:hypothetical protein [uncultured Caulobacter sp.]|uniref:hypothetical protein n=1 Tax=uncultured Caulobacter sp. TaxID=158749 RepID=UPI00262190D6|nr:hypothetical protein [uncultured Caulobacter sp.]
MTASALTPAMRTLRAQLRVPPADPAWGHVSDETRLLGWMLLASRPWPEAASPVLEGLLEAHRDGVEDPALWRRLRGEAVQLGDSDDRLAGLLGKVAEAAAWPLAEAGAGLTEVLTALCQLKAWRAALATGWTEADDVEAIGILTAISAGEGSAAAPSREQIPGLFAEGHPKLERRFSAQLQAATAAYSACRAEVAAWIAGACRRDESE